jgi:hypothetical protein
MTTPFDIPRTAHFVWFGTSFPWANVLAVRSAALAGEFAEVVLHHDSSLEGTPYFAVLVETPKVRLAPLDMPALLARCAPYAAELRGVYDRLRTPATRSDLARYAILYTEGGVYLDIDTVTVASFIPLCEGVSAFCGLERIVYPGTVRRSKNPFVKARAWALGETRNLFRLVPRGYRAFRHIERFYPLAANPAILAASRDSKFLAALLEQVIRTPAERQPEPCVIGPHAIQAVVATYTTSDLAVHPPEVFFPLGPEISQHWFRTVRRADLADVLSPSTRLVHWYASVRTRGVVPLLDPDYVRRNAATQLWSALALPYV